MTSFTNEIAFAELYYTRKIIKDIIGVTPLCWLVFYRSTSLGSEPVIATLSFSITNADWERNVDFSI